MRAIRLYGAGDLRFEKLAMAKQPAAGEVRLKVAFAGICGSDIHNYKTGQWITRSPSTAGHEFSGWVESIGAGVTNLSIGDKVMVDSRHYCGNCPACQVGAHQLCDNLGFVGESIDGGFADFVTLPVRLIKKCDANLKLDVAALVEPLAVALHALNRIRIAANEPLFVVGCGPIGALIAVASCIQSARKLYVCDLDPSRVELITKITQADPLNLTSLLTLNPPARPSHVLDTSGSVKLIEQIIRHTSGLTLGLVGIGSGSFDLDPVTLVEKEISLVGCHAFGDEMNSAQRMLEQHEERFMPLIDHRIRLEQVTEEYRNICNGQAKGIKTLIQLSNEPPAP